MKKLLLCATICCILGGLTLAADQGAIAPAVTPEKTLKIAYVDINKALLQYVRRNDLDTELRGVQDQMRERGRVHMDEVNKLSKAIEQLAMGTPERAALQEKLKAAQDDLEKFRREIYDQMSQEIVTRMNKLYDDVLAAANALGQEKGYDFILKDQTPTVSGENRGEAAVQIAQRVVLYAKPEYDLTSEVVRRLNEAYAKTKPVQPKKPEQPVQAPEKK